MGVPPYAPQFFLFFMYPNYRHSIIHRLNAKAVKRDNGCIEYAGGELKHKYGLVRVGKKVVPAHRAMWMAVNDCLDLASNVHIRHKCDNPCCMNIDHLIAGTPKENAQDCTERGRRAKTHKYARRHLVHDDAKVEGIRNATGKHKWIAEEHGVSVGYVSKIKAGKLKK